MKLANTNISFQLNILSNYPALIFHHNGPHAHSRRQQFQHCLCHSRRFHHSLWFGLLSGQRTALSVRTSYVATAWCVQLDTEGNANEKVIALLAGLTFSPHAANFLKPLEYTYGSAYDLDSITLYFSRLVLGVQLILAGVRKSASFLPVPYICINP